MPFFGTASTQHTALPSSDPTPDPAILKDTDLGLPTTTTDAYNANASILIPDFEVRSKYAKDHHRWYAALASNTPFQGKSAAVFQLAAPTLLWICEWTALKVSTQPQIPDIAVADQNWVLLDEDYESFKVDVGPDMVTPLYRFSGWYVYGHLAPDAETLHNVRFGIPPYLNNQFDRTMPARLRTRNLIDGTAGTGTPAGLNTVGIIKT